MDMEHLLFKIKNGFHIIHSLPYEMRRIIIQAEILALHCIKHFSPKCRTACQAVSYTHLGENPVLLTDADGNLLEEKKGLVSRHEYKKFHEVYEAHHAAPRSKLYLADGYDLVRYYTQDMELSEKAENRERGILILYALPDTKKLGLTEAQAYDVIWSTFHEIQEEALSLIHIYYLVK